MPRKKKSQKQNKTTNELCADLPPPTINTSKPTTHPAQAESATSEKRNNGPTTENEGGMECWTEQALALGLNELDHGASLIRRKHDSKTGDKTKSERKDDNHALIERDPRFVSSTVIRTKSRPKPSTWANVASRRDGECAALDMRVDKTLKDTRLELRQNPNEEISEKEAVPTLTPATTEFEFEEEQTGILRAFKESSKEEKVRRNTKRAAQAAQDKQFKIHSPKDSSNCFTLPTPVPQAIIPILAKERWKQDHVLLRTDLATNSEVAAKPISEGQASNKFQGSDLTASAETKPAAQASQDKKTRLQSLKDLSKNLNLPTSDHQNTVPKVAKGGLGQDCIVAKMKYATNLQKAAKPSNEEKAPGNLQHLQVDVTVEVQESCPPSSSEALDDTTLLTDFAEDGQIVSSNPTKVDVHDPRMKFGEIS